MATVFDVANYFLNFAAKDETSGELLSNLKLQKLVYYAQGFSLAIYNKPLFPEPIEAWTHGPVVPDLYRRFKDFGGSPIPPPADFDASAIFSGEEIELLDEIYNMYGQFSAWKLRNMTHEDAPWLNHCKYSDTIPHNELKEFFSTQITQE